MALQSKIDDLYKSPAVSIRFGNGARPKDIISVDITRNLNDSIGTATITMLTKNGIAPETRVSISQGYDDETLLTFTGIVDTIEHSAFEELFVISCRDLLKKAIDTFLCQEIKFGIDVDAGTYFYSTYSSQSGGTFVVHEYDSLNDLTSNHPETAGNYTNEGVKAEAVVQWLLVMCGLTEGSEIQVDETNFFIGDISPVTFHLTSVFDAITQICDLIGWYVYCDVGGTVRFKQRPRMASAYDTWSYQQGNNIHTITDTTTNTDLRNYVEVHGYSGIKHIARQESPYLGTTVYRGVVIGNDFIDTPEIASFVANRVLADLNRLKETVSITADGNPLLFPGQSIRVSSKVANGQYLLESISTTMSSNGGYKMTMTGATFPGDISEEQSADITADFAITTVTSIGDPKILVEFDGSPSFSTRGPIVSWDWTFPHSTQSGSDPIAWAYFQDTDISGGNSQDVTLTVRDAFGNEDTVTSGIRLEDLLLTNQLVYRHLYAALDVSAAGSVDGGEIWNTYAIPAISVAASNFDANGVFTASGYALFGCSDGTVQKTVDVCVSCYEVLSTGSPVRTIEVPELDSSKAVIGNDSGAIYTSSDAGETWDNVYTFTEPVQQVRFAYTDQTNLMAVAGGKVYDSFDSGQTWTQVNLPIASGVEWNAAGFATNYYAHASGITTIDSEVGFSGGIESPHITAMSIMIDRDDGIMAVDSTGQHWNYSGGMYMTQNNSLNTTQHMIRDGEIPILTYYATQSGVSKSLDRNTTIAELYYPGSVNGQMVAYGPLAPMLKPPPVGHLVIQGKNYVTVSGMTSGLSIGMTSVSGWIPIVDTHLNYGTVAMAGYVVQSYGSTVTFVDIEGTPSGQVPIGINDAWTAPEGEIEVIRFIRRRGLVGCEIFAQCVLDSGLSFDVTAAKLKYTPVNGINFSSFDVTYSNAISIGNAYAQKADGTQDSLSGRLVTSRFFGHPMDRRHHAIAWNTDDMTYTEEMANERDMVYFDPYMAKFDQVWKCLAVVNDSAKRVDAFGEVVDLSITASTPSDDIVDMYDSCLNRSDAYYATLTGVYRLTAYGDGAADILWQVPDGYTIHAFSVTHDKDYTRDYIAVSYAMSSNIRSTVYSTDGGSTWNDGFQISVGSRGYIRGIWYVEA